MKQGDLNATYQSLRATCPGDREIACEESQRLSNSSDVRPDMQLLGSGCYRTVYSLPCHLHVVKFEFGGYESSKEVEIWEQLEARHRYLFCPVLDSGKTAGYYWVIQPRCEPIAYGCGDPRYGAVERKVSRLGFRDLYEPNFGVLDDRVVMLDYGFSASTYIRENV